MSPRPLLLLMSALVALAAAPAHAQNAGTLRGRVIPADTVSPAGLRAVLRWRAAGDTATHADWAVVDSSGRFALRVPSAADTLELTVDVEGAEPRVFHPALVRIPVDSAGREMGIVLMPRRWTIPGGRHAGQVVEVSPARARTPVCPGCTGFWLQVHGERDRAWYQSWHMAAFPLRVAFDREYSTPRGAAPDSAAFWRIVAGMEADFGANLFRPAPYDQTEPQDEEVDDGPAADVVLVFIDPALRVPGLTTVLSRRGTVDYGAVRLQSRDAVTGYGGQRLVTHELMHALGLGHTCAWRSVSADLLRCPALRAEALTPEDVAYTQVLYAVRNLQRATGARWGLEAAMAGERALLTAPRPAAP